MGGKGRGQEEKEWVPVTKLGRLVKDSKIQSIEDIYLHSLPIKEYQIIDSFFAPGTLKDDVMKIHPVQKMTSAGQRNRFVCYVLVGDCNGHIGLGAKCAKDDGFQWHCRLLYLLLRTHQDERQLHEGR